MERGVLNYFIKATGIAGDHLCKLGHPATFHVILTNILMGETLLLSLRHREVNFPQIPQLEGAELVFESRKSGS